MKTKQKTLTYLFAVATSASLIFSSCQKYVTIPVATNQLGSTETFASAGTATSAVLALYSNYVSTYNNLYYTTLGGVESDELQYNYASSTPDINEFQQASVSVTNSTLNNYLWVYPYVVIGEANQAIAGLNSSTTLTAGVKSQLIGESEFFRAFNYFYLVNYFGGVPLAISGDPQANAYLPRISSAAVYAQIISDLKDAENNLPSAYVSTLRTRVNKYAASALLARAYLYTGDYVNAEAEATKVIAASDVSYTLSNVNNAFLNTSNETILQIATLTGASQFGNNYRGSSATALPNYYLYPGFTQSFETGDNRLSAWVDNVVSGGTNYYRINKYKLYSATAGNEYDILLRLAEQYLIRAEARAQQNNITGSQTDINAIRARAGLLPTTASTQTALLSAVAQERKVELFGEFAHRWLDLKRNNTANAVIGALKSTWKSTAVLEPIPYNQLIKNNTLLQNPGY